MTTPNLGNLLAYGVIEVIVSDYAVTGVGIGEVANSGDTIIISPIEGQFQLRDAVFVTPYANDVQINPTFVAGNWQFEGFDNAGSEISAWVASFQIWSIPANYTAFIGSI